MVDSAIASLLPASSYEKPSTGENHANIPRRMPKDNSTLPLSFPFNIIFLIKGNVHI